MTDEENRNLYHNFVEKKKLINKLEKKLKNDRLQI